MPRGSSLLLSCPPHTKVRRLSQASGTSASASASASASLCFCKTSPLLAARPVCPVIHLVCPDSRPPAPSSLIRTACQCQAPPSLIIFHQTFAHPRRCTPTPLPLRLLTPYLDFRRLPTCPSTSHILFVSNPIPIHDTPSTATFPHPLLCWTGCQHREHFTTTAPFC